MAKTILCVNKYHSAIQIKYSTQQVLKRSPAKSLCHIIFLTCLSRKTSHRLPPLPVADVAFDKQQHKQQLKQKYKKN